MTRTCSHLWGGFPTPVLEQLAKGPAFRQRWHNKQMLDLEALGVIGDYRGLKCPQTALCHCHGICPWPWTPSANRRSCRHLARAGSGLEQEQAAQLPAPAPPCLLCDWGSPQTLCALTASGQQELGMVGGRLC